jgi:tetratricopeptide (TPR) repeat protein
MHAGSAMGRSAGRTGAGERWDRADLQVNGASYKVGKAAAGYRLEFERGDVRGSRTLEWFIGSGRLGRSYVFSSGGFLYQAPVSYYAATSNWRLSPGYEGRQAVDLTRAIEPACLRCHASRLQPIAGTQNRFEPEPFLEGGVSCERCHGPGQDHVVARRAGRSRPGDIVNPARLQADARDSVCAQCHLTGAARVARKAKSAAYRPGDLLSSSLAVFVWSESAADLSATSHYERLNQSACKKASGDKLWCGTCHNPHAPAGSTGYRETCLRCHSQKVCSEEAAIRRSAGDDCASCHMPKGASRTVEHLAFTDHGIVRRKAAPRQPAGEKRLTPFWRDSDDRDLALAYAVAATTEPSVRRRALDMLEAAAKNDANDVAILSQLANFYDRLGRDEQARELCERVLSLDPTLLAAAVNLGTYRAKLGDSAGAIRLWTDALQRNPALTGVRVNLAVAHFRSGKPVEAEAELRKALEYDPDSPVARRLLAEVRAGAAG